VSIGQLSNPWPRAMTNWASASLISGCDPPSRSNTFFGPADHFAFDQFTQPARYFNAAQPRFCFHPLVRAAVEPSFSPRVNRGGIAGFTDLEEVLCLLLILLEAGTYRERSGFHTNLLSVRAWSPH
jgi:hypothetical protein